MDRSAERNLGERTVADILRLLREDKLAFDIDLPIDRVLNAFLTHSSFPITQRRFIDILSQLVGHAYREAIALPREISPDAARAEAIWILEMAFYRAGPDSYDTAWLCARSSEDGLHSVLRRVAETIKALERDKYRRWVFASQVKLRSWPERCEIARAPRDEFQHVLPPALAAQSPGELADHIQELVEALQQSASEARQLTGGAVSLTAI